MASKWPWRLSLQVYTIRIPSTSPAVGKGEAVLQCRATDVQSRAYSQVTLAITVKCMKHAQYLLLSWTSQQKSNNHTHVCREKNSFILEELVIYIIQFQNHSILLR